MLLKQMSWFCGAAPLPLDRDRLKEVVDAGRAQCNHMIDMIDDLYELAQDPEKH